MNDDVRTSSSAGDVSGGFGRVQDWVLLGGNRVVLAAGLVLVVVAVFAALVAVGLVAVGAKSTAGTLFASGLTSGTLTLVTVALSINQLLLSRVFGSPSGLTDRLDGTRDLRRRVQRRADEPVAPNDPADFLSVVAQSLEAHARAFGSAVEGSGLPEEVERYADDVADYAGNVEGKLESQTSIVDVLDVVSGTAYADNMTATEYVRNEYADRLSDEARDHLEAIDDLVEAIAVARQFFKTITLQQNFARLSRLVSYTGFLALLACIGLSLVYRSNGVTVPPAVLPALVSVGVGVIVTPLALLIAYVLRAATIARRTVSVGPFIPPDERPTDE